MDGILGVVSDVDQLVGWVTEFVHLHAKLGKVLHTLLRRPVVNGVTISEQDYLIKSEKDLRLRLVDCANDSLVVLDCLLL